MGKLKPLIRRILEGSPRHFDVGLNKVSVLVADQGHSGLPMAYNPHPVFPSRCRVGSVTSVVEFHIAEAVLALYVRATGKDSEYEEKFKNVENLARSRWAAYRVVGNVRHGFYITAIDKHGK